MIWWFSFFIFDITLLLLTGLFKPFTFQEATLKLLYPMITVQTTCADQVNICAVRITNNKNINNHYKVDFQPQGLTLPCHLHKPINLLVEKQSYNK